MKLCDNTVEILKNFSSINQGLVVKPGKLLRTISANKAILAEANIDEEFQQEFGIYDLNKTLGLLSMNKADAEVVVEKEFLTFTGLAGMAKIRQRFTPINLIFAPPNKSINISSFDVTLTITPEIHKWIFSVASILKCPNIVIQSDGSDITISAQDVKGEIVDDASVKVDGTSAIKFVAVLKIENLKIIDGEYTVELSAAGVSKFTHKNKNLIYWIALEQSSSKFEK
jgi:hypothetical protein